jgi:hypothetical protein
MGDQPHLMSAPGERDRQRRHRLKIAARSQAGYRDPHADLG